MDPLERLERIRALQAAAAEHRAEIARREAERGASDDDSDLDDYSQGVVRFTVEYVKQKLVERDERIDTLEEEVVRLKRAIRELARRGKRRA